MNPEPRADRPLVIGLLGGIAAGKSTVASIFGEHGFSVIDADQVAREAITWPAVRAAIESRFGPGIFDPAGELDREALAEIVFRDQAALADLEGILHPPVRQAILDRLEAARSAGTPVLLDVPLLLERGLIEHCDHNVFLEADAAVRTERARARGWEDGELARREATQAPLSAKRGRCAFSVRTDVDVAETRKQIEAILDSGWAQ